jgi:hypothetical protein
MLENQAYWVMATGGGGSIKKEKGKRWRTGRAKKAKVAKMVRESQGGGGDGGSGGGTTCIHWHAAIALTQFLSFAVFVIFCG